MTAEEQEDLIQKVDSALQHWRQGDFVLQEDWFSYRFDPNCPISDESKDIVQQDNPVETDLAESGVPGFVVITQTCDIVRPSLDRPFLEIAPLEKVDNEKILKEIQRGKRPRYAYIPGCADQFLVADLDRVMTVEKAVVARQWTRNEGCKNEQEVRQLSHALARKRIRPAFPDDFIEVVKPLLDRMTKKHDKNSLEGKLLRELREIRVCASPSWNSSEVELMFYFMANESSLEEGDQKGMKFQGQPSQDLLYKWLELMNKSGRFQTISGKIVTLEDITAKEYIESDRLDLDHLSYRR